MRIDNNNIVKNIKRHSIPIGCILIITMFLGMVMLPGNLSPIVNVRADFGTPYNENIYVDRIWIKVVDALSPYMGTTTYMWENGVNGSMVMNIPGIYNSESGYTNVYLEDIFVEAQIDYELFKDADPSTNSYCRYRYWNPISAEWSSWFTEYPETTTNYVATYHFEPDIYLYASTSSYTIQFELWGVLA